MRASEYIEKLRALAENEGDPVLYEWRDTCPAGCCREYLPATGPEYGQINNSEMGWIL